MERGQPNYAREGMSLEGHIPGGIWARLTGIDVKSVFVVIIFCMCTAVVYLQLMTNARASTERDAVTQAMLAKVAGNQAEIIRLIGDGQRKVERGMVIWTYVSTLSEVEKRSLHLEMPDELRYNARPR